MSVFNRSEEQRCLDELHHPDEEVIGSLCRLSDRAASPGNVNMDTEKRIRREIANSNERRRMQSINAGFQSLRTLLPHHEGEKLSKAAILQQTAEYIYQLEQEKTSLLSQNCQLKRLVNQHEGQQHDSAAPPSSAAAPPGAKKRKLDGVVVATLTAVPPSMVACESSDEGLGSMSPEPVALGVNNAVPGGEDPSREMIELRVQLDRERRQRLHLEDQVRSLEHQLYPERIREITQQVHLQYHHQEVVEHESVSLMNETAVAVAQLEMVTESVLPLLEEEEVGAASPLRLATPSPPLAADTSLVAARGADEQRLPSVLEAAIKAEPKVEVERLPSPTSDDVIPQARLFLNSTSRQNLETIVEAIRHLEGDHLFRDEPPQQQSPPPPPRHHHQAPPPPPATAQEKPLALTKKVLGEPTQQQVAQRLLKVEMNPYLQFHVINPGSHRTLQQQRPGVIVVKQQT